MVSSARAIEMTELSARFDQTTFAPYWLGTIAAPNTNTPQNGELHCDIGIVGAGFTGLWAALKARERHPDARIVVLEARKLAQAASGRTGGFAAPSISHGVMARKITAQMIFSASRRMKDIPSSFGLKITAGRPYGTPRSLGLNYSAPLMASSKAWTSSGPTFAAHSS